MPGVGAGSTELPTSGMGMCVSFIVKLAFVGVALGAATGAPSEHTVRVAANQLKKVADDVDKKRRREEKATGSAASQAQRRANHAVPDPRAPVGRAPGGRPAKRDRRTFEGRTVARKKRRVEEDRRRVEIVGGSGKGSGKGSGGTGSGGKGGGKGSGKGSGGKKSGMQTTAAANI